MATLLVIAVLIGLGAGCAARLLAGYGGRGLVGDLLVGVIGSVAASLMFRAFAIAPDTGVSAMAATACLGAGAALFAQRYLWPAPLRPITRGAPRQRP